MPIVYREFDSDYTFEVLTDDAPPFVVVGWEGKEWMSRPFRYTLHLASEEHDLDPYVVLGKQALLTIRGVEEDRFVHGVISKVTRAGAGSQFARYEVELVPALWFLGLDEEFRIFQDMSVQDIVTEILEEVGIKGEDWVEWKLAGALPERVYTVCYRESKLAFVSRLLSEEGVFFYFRHRAECHVLVLGDDPTIHQPIEGVATVPFRAELSRDTDNEFVHKLARDVRVRPTVATLRDFNFEKPLETVEASFDETGGASTDGHPAATGIEVYHYPGGFLASADGDRVARIQQERLRSHHDVVSGEANCRRLAPGAKFELSEHPTASYDGEYLVTSVSHRGAQPAVVAPETPSEGVTYECRFNGMPADIPFRPNREWEKPRVYGVQTALVVGPSGEEIYTEGYGRVKVQFHWDRRGEYDEKSSCWLRVVQAWAGAGMGHFFLPRIGDEVLVEFLEGDPDRPIITGSVHNGSNYVPLSMPDEKTKGTIKTLSTPGGEGFNELRFEDKSGEEQVFFHAQKDYDKRVLNDNRTFVGNDDHEIVKNDRTRLVENDEHVKVVRHRQVEIGKDDNLAIKGKRAIEVTQSSSLTVKGDVIESFKANHSEECAGDIYVKGMNLVVEGALGMTLKVGGNSVVIDPSGVTIKGTLVTVDGAMVKIASGPGSPAKAGKAGSAVAPTSPAKAAEADENVAGEVAKVKEQSFQEPDPEDVDVEETTWIEIELIGEDDEGIPGEPFKLTTPDGEVVRGTTGPDGKAKIKGLQPGSCKVTFPELDQEAWEPA